MYTPFCLAFLTHFSFFFYYIILIPEVEGNYKDKLENWEEKTFLSKKKNHEQKKKMRNESSGLSWSQHKRLALYFQVSESQAGTAHIQGFASYMRGPTGSNAVALLCCFQTRTSMIASKRHKSILRCNKNKDVRR